jgi:flagellar protein FliS
VAPQELSGDQAKKLADSYKATAVSTATPGALILMLFDGALSFIARAEYGFTLDSLARRNEEVHNNLTKAQSILRELQVSLDLDRGGEFSTQLFGLYDFMIDQLLEANVKKEVDRVQTVKNFLRDIRDAWAEMLQKFQAQ